MPVKRKINKSQANSEGLYHSLPIIFALLAAIITAPILMYSAIVSAEEDPDIVPIQVTSEESPLHDSFIQKELLSMDEPAAVPSYATGAPQCLDRCRSTLTSCLNTRINTIIDGFAESNPEGSSIDLQNLMVTDLELQACRINFSTCSSSCVPSAVPAITCEMACGARLNSCMQAAGDSEEAFAVCRVDSISCIRQCGGRPTESVPVSSCFDQCRFALATCLEADPFNTIAEDSCYAMARRCGQDLCSHQTLSQVGILRPAEIRSTCASRCRSEYQLCSDIARGDQEAGDVCYDNGVTCLESCQNISISLERAIETFPLAEEVIQEDALLTNEQPENQ